MSLLNNGALNSLLLEQDILSVNGIIQSIWKDFTKNIDYRNTQNSISNFILKLLDDNVFSHLMLSDKSCINTIDKFSKSVSDINKKTNNSSVLTNFLLVVCQSLYEYSSIKDKSIGNITINMNESTDVSIMDEIIIIDSFVKNGLINPVEIQDLLDSQYLDMVTTAKSCIGLCGKSELPLNTEGSDVQRTQPLSLKDFGTDVDSIIDCVNRLLESNENKFPCSPKDLERMLINVDNINNQNIIVKNLIYMI